MNLFGLGVPEILLILVVALIFFGKDKLPDFANSIGRSFKELKNGFEDGVKNDTVKKNDTMKSDSTKSESVIAEPVEKNVVS
jgi:sec-independent protein translocase protein TatA